MGKTTFLHLCLFLCIVIACHGYPDLPYFYEIRSCPDNVEERESVPFYEFDKPQQPFDKRSGFAYYPDFSSSMSSEDWKEFSLKKEGASQTPFESNASRKKRSVDEEENLIENSVDHQENDMAILPSMSREGRNNIKTIHLPSSFTPRLGKKRSSEKSRDNDFPMSGKAHVINLNAGSAFTPRLGRSEGSTRIQWNAGSAFTPRLGRSESVNRIRLNAGNGFTPRLGRSESPNRIQVNAGSAFTPRLGRSENPNRIVLNAGSSFTPRFG
ncbi:uncharacterized protein LOC129960418 [Argiope bruennichi]|uniref:Uncharacterized protein n=1 Tax=Argiope bruennichi TaxID=94029 RepID=A0A8T0FNU0_ARGBR|nr:uncharacterized protein LOC129960418 [Argiope bruennichi]KAF8791120.1 hypothetical protein HNY73_006043 [Argiope bruennichi]